MDEDADDERALAFAVAAAAEDPAAAATPPPAPSPAAAAASAAAAADASAAAELLPLFPSERELGLEAPPPPSPATFASFLLGLLRLPDGVAEHQGPRSTALVAADADASCFYRGRTRSPASRVSRLRLCVRKVVGDPNVPSGHFTAVADVSEAGAVTPIAAALPPGPVLQFAAGAAPRFVDIASAPLLAAFRTTAFINRDPRAFHAEAMSAKLFVVRSADAGAREGARAGVFASASALASASAAASASASAAEYEYAADTRHFLLLWEDESDFPHVTAFSRLAFS